MLEQVETVCNQLELFQNLNKLERFGKFEPDMRDDNIRAIN